MARVAASENRAQAAALIVGCVFLFVAFGLIVYGRFCTSIGMAGLYSRASLGAAFILFGISMAIFTPCVALQRMRGKRIRAEELARELVGLVLGFLCYVVPFFLMMGALSAADSIGVAAFVLMVAFGAVPFAYRGHRKKHPIRYEHTGSAALVAFCAVLALVSFVGGAYSCGGVARDLGAGWRQDTFAFYEADVDRPSGRYSAMTPTTYEVSLYRDAESVENGQVDARLTVNASDWPEVEAVLDEPMAEVRWYPETRTLVGARDVDGPLAAGDPID